MKPKIAIPEPCSYDPEYSRWALPHYVQAIESCGGEAVVVPLGLPPDEMARLIMACSAVLLPGSKADIDPQKYGAERQPQTAQADPLRDTADELLLQDAYNMRKPVFGICYGLQSLNVWRSGTLVQHLQTVVDHSPSNKAAPAHQVKIEGDSLLAREMGVDETSPLVPVNSSHHQAADTVGDALRVVARSSADGVIEAVEGTLPGHHVLAVQWHPERDFTENVISRSLFEKFTEFAQKWTEAQGTKRTKQEELGQFF